MYKLAFLLLLFSFTTFNKNFEEEPDSWIRINLLGYTPGASKVAVWCSSSDRIEPEWQLIEAATQKVVLTGKSKDNFGAYGPFKQTMRIDFSSWKKPGKYYLRVGKTSSPAININYDVYKGTADFCLRYMRQQRTGFNPFLKDSCHTQDGYTLYGQSAGLPDSTFVDVTGGWHDASDYLQYATTSANATWHLLAAYRDFPHVFADTKLSNGLEGSNGLADVADEAKWGINWLLKMHPKANWMFNQIADDRDHARLRMPGLDSFYGIGHQRPVYFINGEPQQRGKLLNNTRGTSSTAAKMASAFALAHYLLLKDSAFKKLDKRGIYYDKALDAFRYAQKKPGVTQTASVKAPYIYAEENWVDDMELASASIHDMVINTPAGGDNGYYMIKALTYAKQEKITPWLGADTASHYQWYPFINAGHYELAKQLRTRKNGPVAGYTKQFISELWNKADTVVQYYRQGIQKVWNKAKSNAFYRGIPFIWCSNNLTVSFAIQCYWYRELSGDRTFSHLEQANFDWLFGCNPWGTSMVYGLPSWGDTPTDPHSAFTYLKKYPIDGGLVDGPVYGSIYNSLIGIKLYQPDEYAQFQSELAVYHDDFGDYSTNEPTMDGTASLIYLLAAREAESQTTELKKGGRNYTYDRGAITRGDSTQKKLALVFTGHEFSDGGHFLAQALSQQHIRASFFFTGDFYRDPANQSLINALVKGGHFLGNHSSRHLLYCDWKKRDSLLVSKEEFVSDLTGTLEPMQAFRKANGNPPNLRTSDLYFLPPYEWYNEKIAEWCGEVGKKLINFTPGTLSAADYTTPSDKNYRTSDEIYRSVVQYENTRPSGLNGFLLLMHVGTDPKRTDKFYKHIPRLIKHLKAKGYQFQTVDMLLPVQH